MAYNDPISYPELIPQPEFDVINRAAQYNQAGIECIEVLIQLGIAKPFCRANAIKYLWRCEDKNGLEDLKKARWYLNKLIELEERVKSVKSDLPQHSDRQGIS